MDWPLVTERRSFGLSLEEPPWCSEDRINIVNKNKGQKLKQQHEVAQETEKYLEVFIQFILIKNANTTRWGQE